MNKNERERRWRMAVQWPQDEEVPALEIHRWDIAYKEFQGVLAEFVDFCERHYRFIKDGDEAKMQAIVYDFFGIDARKLDRERTALAYEAQLFTQGVTDPDRVPILTACMTWEAKRGRTENEPTR